MVKAMNRREFLKLTGVMAGGALLAACGAGATDSPPTGEEEPGDEPAAPEDVTLEFWTFNDYAVGQARELFMTFISEFEEANPGISVNLTGKPGTDIKTGLIAGAGAGELPDAVQIQLGAGGDLLAAGALADVRSFWDASSDEYKEQFTPNVMDLLLKEGGCWGLPFTGYATILYRNLNVLDEAGIDPDAGVSDWADFEQQLMAVNEAGLMGKCRVLGQNWVQKHWYGGVSGTGQETISEDGLSTLMEADAYAQLFEYMLSLKPYTAEPFMPDTAATDLFVTNQVAFVSMGPWLAPTLEEAVTESGLAYDAIQIPGQTSEEFGGVRGGEFTPVMPGDNVEAAWKWAKFVSDSPQTSRFASELGRYLANDRALAQPEVQENWLVQLTATAFNDAIDEGPFMKQVAAGWSQPEIDYGTLVYEEQMEPQEAAEQMIAEMNEILSEGP
jgi:multiple sugar transport system substrate-binding protein